MRSGRLDGGLENLCGACIHLKLFDSYCEFMVTVFSSSELRDLGVGADTFDECIGRIRRGWFVLKKPCENTAHEVLHEIHEASGHPYPQTFGDIRDSTEQLKTLIRSYARELLPGSFFSHVSAAIIHGLDPPFPTTTAAELIRSGYGKRKQTVHYRNREVGPDDRARVGDLPVTSMRRTLLDLAHDYPSDVSVPFISQALREGKVSKTSLESGIRLGGRGCRNAQLALELASPLHESAGEALCAVRFHRFGITGMITQVDSFDASGSWIARNDFRHETLPLVVEFHGLGKYFLNEGGPDRASAKNHERHMKLLNSGLRVFNLVWGDLFRAQPFMEIKAELKALASSRSPLGIETATSARRSRR